jgi:hypothetical protein
MRSFKPPPKSETDFVSPADKHNSMFERLANFIGDRRDDMAQALYEVGRALIDAKGALIHGEFLSFLRDPRVGMEPRHAQLLMKIASEYDGRKLAGYGIAKASLLLRLPPEARKRMIENQNISQLSVSRLRNLIADAVGHGDESKKAANGKGRAEAEYQRGYIDGFRKGLGAQGQLSWAAGVLHVNMPELSTIAIEAAFRKMVNIFHPDKARAEDAKFIRNIYEARQLLLAHTRRSRAAA